MLKRCLAMVLSVVLAASGLTSTAYAQPENEAPVGITAEAPLEAAEAVVETEAVEAEVPTVSGEATVEAEVPAVSGEATVEAEVSAEAVDVLEADADITYDVTVPEPEYNLVECNVDIHGYSSWNDYYDGKQITVLVSETEDFSSYQTMSSYKSNSNNDDGYVLTYYYAYHGKENTTYYVKAAYDDYSTGYVDVSEVYKVTTKSKKEFTYTVVCEEPANTFIEYKLTVEGYKDWTDYNKYGSISILISENEDFSNYNYMSVGITGFNPSENEMVLTVTGTYSGKENTTYYIKAVRYEGTENKDLTEVTTVTTKERKNLTASLKTEDIGASYCSINAAVSGDNYSNMNGTIYIQYSTDANFAEDYSYDSVYFYSDDAVGEDAYEDYLSIDYLKPETTYYFRLAYREYDSENATYVFTAIGDVLAVTTQADETYSADIIADEVLRQAIASKLPTSNGEAVWSKVNLEKITYITCDRNSISDTPVKALTGLEYLVNLREVSLRRQEITDISVLAKLPRLYYAYLDDNKLTAIPDLSALTELGSLSLNGNYISASEFVAGNTKLPGNMREQSWWLQNTADAQRTSETPGIVAADTYYNNKAASWALQVEANNVYSLSSYTLSVYAGEEALQENAAPSINNSNYNVIDWMFDGFVTEAGTKTLTFVLYADGVEANRVTKEITFTDGGMSLSSSKYITPKTTYYWLSAQYYSYNKEVAKFEILDASGAVVYEDEDLISIAYSDNYDSRYGQIFKVNAIKCDYVSFSQSINFTKYLKEGEYDFRITFTDGESRVVEKQLIVTSKPVLTSMSSSYSYYSNAVNNEYLYVGVSGSGLDCAKVSPAIYDTDGNVVSEVVDYKLTDTFSAIYKVRNVSGQDWNRNMEIKLVHDASYVIVNEGQNKYTVSLGNYADIYYTEHVPDNNTIKVLTENINNGEYTFELLTDYSGTVLATCKAVVTDSMAILRFTNEDGSDFVFDTTKNVYYVRVYYNGTSYTTKYVENINYGSSSGSSNSYNMNIDYYSLYYINNGTAFDTGYILDKRAFEEGAVLTAQILDGEKNVVSDIAVSYSEIENDAGDKVWNVRTSFENLNLENDTRYYLALYNGKEALGAASLAVLDPEKPYWTSIGTSFAGNMSTMTLAVRGYYPENIDTAKFGARFLDKNGNLIYEAAATSVTKDEKATGLISQRYYLQMDISQVIETLQEYVSVEVEITYDGKVVPYLYMTGNDKTMNFNNNYTYDYFMTDYQTTYRRRQIYGVHIGTREAVKVLVYLPYDAEPLAALEIPAGDEYQYKFTVNDFAKLSYNSFQTRYEFVLVDSEGKYLDYEEGYLKASLAFTDLPTDETNWQYVAANYVFQNSIMSGTSTTTFAPNASMTRAMFVQTLYNMEKTPAVTDRDIFTDVVSTAWYRKAVIWAVDNNITSGVGEGLFGSDTPINREQLATLLYNYAKSEGYDVSGRTSLDNFNDGAAVSDWATESLQWAVNAGIMSGKPQADGSLNLDPAAKATRAECATMIRNFCMKYVD